MAKDLSATIQSFFDKSTSGREVFQNIKVLIVHQRQSQVFQGLSSRQIVRTD
jgi:hypothetical protein